MRRGPESTDKAHSWHLPPRPRGVAVALLLGVAQREAQDVVELLVRQVVHAHGELEEVCALCAQLASFDELAQFRRTRPAPNASREWVRSTEPTAASGGPQSASSASTGASRASTGLQGFPHCVVWC